MTTETETSTETTATDTAAPADTADTAAPASMPEGLPEQFWDGDAGQVKTGDLINAYNDAAGKVPEGYVKVPGDDASPEELKAWRETFGIPDDPAGYEFAPAEGQEFSDTDKAFHDAMRPILHKIGIPAEDAQMLAEGFMAWSQQAMQEQREAVKNEYAKGFDELDAQWKKAGRDPDAMEGRAKAVLEAFGNDRFKEMLRGSGLHEAPAMLEFVAEVGQKFEEIGYAVGENRFVEGKTPVTTTERTPAQRMYPDMPSAAF